mgnify:CR=1 FL=1
MAQHTRPARAPLPPSPDLKSWCERHAAELAQGRKPSFSTYSGFTVDPAYTPESLAAQAEWQASRPYVVDPAMAIEQGRPTKSDRRQLVEWQRWSASLDDDA